MTDLIGRTLGQYQIIEQVGQGGMATVYKAYQPGLDRHVALKVLLPLHAKQSGFSERFEREAKAIAKLNHPNILPVHDFGQEEQYSFITMRYIEGARTLKEVMAGSLNLAQVTGLIEQIAAALDYAHRQRVIHRDVKPSNVLMDGDWALLSDFGLAKMTEASVKLTGTGVGIGTPAYMSPEQGQGEPVDHRTDIYALGIVLFEMLTGQIPHEAETPFGIILKRMADPLPLPRSLNPAIPEPMEQVILKALAYEPDDRFASAGALAAALKESGSGAVVEAVGRPSPMGEEQSTAPLSEAVAPTRPQVEQVSRAPQEIIGLSEQATEDQRSAEGMPARKTNIFQLFVQSVPLPVMIGLGIVILIVLSLSVTNLESVRVAPFAAKTPTATPLATNTPSSAMLPKVTNTPSTTPTPTPTSLPFAPAGDDETLILVAAFHNTEGVVDTDAHNEIRRAIQEAIAELGLSNLRVEVEPTRLTADAQAEAEKLGTSYNASMVIWGADTGVRITVNYLNLKEPDLSAADVRISETERTQLANPSAYASFITRDMPTQLTFLSLFAIGQSYYIEREYDEAIMVIEKAIALLTPEMDPPEGISSAYFRLGWLYQGPTNDLRAAIAAYDRAIELNPDLAVAVYNRGIAYADSGDLEQAIRDYTTAIELDPNYVVAFHNRGFAYADSGDLEQAIRDYTTAIELNPDYTIAFYNRGLAYADSGDLEQAMRDYTTAIELNPDYANAWNNLCWFGSLSGQAAEVIDACERAVELTPDNGTTRDSRGLARALTGDYEGAIADFKFYVEWSKENGRYEPGGLKREAWIAELESGQNPFDEATLEDILNK